MKAKIYRIVCNITGLQYIGSTTTSLSQRLGTHVAHYKKKMNDVNWTDGETSWVVLQAGDYDIILIENVEVDDLDELKRQERHYVETLECVNINRPIITKDERIQQMRDYYKNHRQDRLDRYKREKDYWHEKVNCEICDKKISRQHFKEHERTKSHIENLK